MIRAPIAGTIVEPEEPERLLGVLVQAWEPLCRISVSGARPASVLATQSAPQVAARPTSVEMPEWDRKVYEHLNKRVSLAFSETPLADVVEFLKATTPVNYGLIREDLPPDGAPVSLVIETTLGNALDQICDLTEMDWKVEGGLIKIGAPESLRDYQMRVYDVRDLLLMGRPAGKPQFDELAMERAANLALLIKLACGEGTWMELSTAGIIRVGEGEAPPVPPSAPVSLRPMPRARAGAGGGFGGGGGGGFGSAGGGFGFGGPAAPPPPAAAAAQPRGRIFLKPEDLGILVIVQSAEVHECIEAVLGHMRGQPARQKVPEPAISEEMLERLQTQVSLAFHQTPVWQIVEFLRHTTAVNYVLFEKDLPREGAPVTVSVETTLGHGLDLMCELSGLAWEVKEDVVRIGSRDRIEQRMERPWIPAVPAEMPERLAAPVSLAAEDVPITQVVEFLQHATSVQIVLFPQDLPEGKPTVAVQFEGTLRDAVNDICDQTGLAWQVEGPVIKIGSRERLEARTPPSSDG